MDLFFRLLMTAISALLSVKTATILTGTQLTRSIGFTDRDRKGRLLNSRISSFCDHGTINFFIRTNIYKALRRRGWVPVILGYHIVSHHELVGLKKMVVHTRVASWKDQYVNLHHDFYSGETLLVEVDVAARLLSPEREPVLATDILDEMGISAERPEPRPGFLSVVENYRSLRAQAGS